MGGEEPLMLVPLHYPPGMVRTGTNYSAKGRWIDGNLVRWREGIMQAVPGWVKLSKSDDSQVDGSNPVRGMHAWADNLAVPQLAFGTYTHLYHFTQGTLTDITPVGMTKLTTGGSEGNIARITTGGYGQGAFGAGAFGVGDTAISTIQEATTWQLDNYGEDLIALAYGDGSIWRYDLSLSTMAVLTNAPIDCAGVVVTPERFIVALGPADDPRKISWADQDDPTDWTASPTNQAGDTFIATPGVILAGRRLVDETLIWTSTDLYTMRYVGGTFIYSVPQVGQACGAVSRHCMATFGGQAAWMGSKSFYVYTGQVQALDCPVADAVFGDINETQISQIWAEHRSDHHEIWWHYPSAAANTCDKHVVWNYKENWWALGSGMRRTAGVDQGVFQNPILADDTGKVWKHELGSSRLDPDSTELVPYIEGAPFEIGNGDQVMEITSFIPDEATLGDLDVAFYTSMYPTDSEAETAVSSTQPTDVRLTARQARLKLTEDQPGWRWGMPRIEVVAGSRR